MDLFAGIGAYPRTRLFLVIGDPGSGKSVALRKLCHDLLDRAEGKGFVNRFRRQGRIPIYVNLREFSIHMDNKGSVFKGYAFLVSGHSHGGVQACAG